jgi:hypothetical protein
LEVSRQNHGGANDTSQNRIQENGPVESTPERQQQPWKTSRGYEYADVRSVTGKKSGQAITEPAERGGPPVLDQARNQEKRAEAREKSIQRRGYF